jgi:membrane-associated protein
MGGEDGRRRLGGWWWTLLSLVGCTVLLALIVLWQPLSGGSSTFEDVEAGGPWSYFAVFALIFGDAIFPVLPGETTLNVAATMAASGLLELRYVMVAGAAGAVLGDSTLYWIAHVMRPRVQHRLDVALANDKVARVMAVIGSSAPALLVFGRYVPGMRFVVNASLGLAGHPYREFLRWSALGGVLWSVYCCTVAYLVGTALVAYPLASVVVSALASSVAVAVVFVVLLRRLRATPSPAGDDPAK